MDDKFDFDFSYQGKGNHIGEDAHACVDYLGKIRGSHRYDVPPANTLIESDSYLNWASNVVHVCISSYNSILSRFFFSPLFLANLPKFFGQSVSAMNHLVLQYDCKLKRAAVICKEVSDLRKSLAAEQATSAKLAEECAALKQSLAHAEDNLALAAGENVSLEVEKEHQMKRLGESRTDWVLQ